MYTEYAYINGAIAIEVLADLAALFTGETILSNLSTSCDQAASSITSTVSAGWILHDQVDTSNVVIKAAHIDDVAKFKFVRLSIEGVSGVTFYIRATIYEDWNATTHTGSNASTSASTTYDQRFTTNETGLSYLFSSPRFLCFLNSYGTVWGDYYGGPLLVAEHSRIPVWNTITNDMPSFALFVLGASIGASSFGYKYVYSTRSIANNGGTMTGDNARTMITTIGVYNGSSLASPSYFPDGADQRIPDENTALFVPFFPIYHYDPPVFGVPLGEISSISDVHLAPKNLLGNLEVIPRDGNDYMALKVRGSSSLIEGHRLILPKR